MNTAELMCCLIIRKKMVTYTPMRKKKSPFGGLAYLIGSISKSVFGRRMSTGSEDFSLLICLDAIKFVLLSFFTVVEKGDSGGGGGGEGGEVWKGK